MPVYQSKSVQELRFEDYKQDAKGTASTQLAALPAVIVAALLDALCQGISTATQSRMLPELTALLGAFTPSACADADGKHMQALLPSVVYAASQLLATSGQDLPSELLSLISALKRLSARQADGGTSALAWGWAHKFCCAAVAQLLPRALLQHDMTEYNMT